MDIDLSYNWFSARYLNDLIQMLPAFQIENLNLSNSMSSQTMLNNETNFVDAFTKSSIGFNLRSLGLRGFYLNTDQTTQLIEYNLKF